MQLTFGMIKPDAFQRGLTGEILSRIQRAKFQLLGLKLLLPSESLVRRFYAVHEGKPFFPQLLKNISGSPCVAMALRAEGGIQRFRELIGNTNPMLASPGTIRGDFGMNLDGNSIHGSDSPENAERELELFFPEARFEAISAAIATA